MRIRPQRGWEVGVSTVPTVGKSLRVPTFVTNHGGSEFLPYRQWVILAVGKSLRVYVLPIDLVYLPYGDGYFLGIIMFGCLPWGDLFLLTDG